MTRAGGGGGGSGKSGRGGKPGRAGPSGPPAGGRALHVRVKSSKGRTVSSARWLQRQLNDPYVAAATAHGYRSRSAFKLAQLDDRFHFLKTGRAIVDLGAAPGGWTQVAIERSPGADVIAVDINPMDPLPGARVLTLDFLDIEAPETIAAALERPPGCVLSDMAAAATGHRPTDHLRTMALCEAAAEFAFTVLAPGGSFVGKVLKGGTENALLARMKRCFASVRHAKPAASRADSSESYVIAMGFRAMGFRGASGKG